MKTKRIAPILESNEGRVFIEKSDRRIDICGCGNRFHRATSTNR